MCECVFLTDQRILSKMNAAKVSMADWQSLYKVIHHRVTRSHTLSLSLFCTVCL